MPEASDLKILGGVLAGGLSRRMGGVDKSLLEFANTSMICSVVRRFEIQLPRVIINANGNTERFQSLDNWVVSDIIEDYAGPLAGIHALLHYALDAGEGYTHIASVASDTPFFPNHFVENCVNAIRDTEATAIKDEVIVIAKSGGFNHPVFGLWPVKCSNALGNFLKEQETRKVMAFVKSQAHCFAEFEFETMGSDSVDPFFNINTPQDLELAKELHLGFMTENSDGK